MPDMIRLSRFGPRTGVIPTVASSGSCGDDRADNSFLIFEERLKQRQRDQGHDVDDHPQGERDDELLGGLAADELHRRIDAVDRDESQASQLSNSIDDSVLVD